MFHDPDSVFGALRHCLAVHSPNPPRDPTRNYPIVDDDGDEELHVELSQSWKQRVSRVAF